MALAYGRQIQRSSGRQSKDCGPVQSQRKTAGTRHIPATRAVLGPFLLTPGPFKTEDALAFPAARIHNVLKILGLQLQTGLKWTQMASEKGFLLDRGPLHKLTRPQASGELRNSLHPYNPNIPEQHTFILDKKFGLHYLYTHPKGCRLP